MSLPFLAFALLEAVLTGAGSGENLQLVESVDPTGSTGTCRFNPRVDRAYYGGGDLHGPESRPFLVPKPAEVYRIVVVGGSTVVGFPYQWELAFPRLLEILLRQQNPQREFEVLNAGITAVNSLAEADVVSQALACEPDLIIVHTGHNEFVGPGGVASKTLALPPRWAPAAFAVRRSRSYQLAARIFSPQAVTKLEDHLPGDLRIAIDSPLVRRAEEVYRANLERMVRTAARAGVGVVLTTPVTNLRHQSPFQSLSNPALEPSASLRWQEAFDAGQRSAASGRHDEALRAFDEAWAIDNGHALLAYRRAQALEALDRWDEARVAYRRAGDLDAARFRAPSSFARIVEQVVAEAKDERVQFLDTAEGIAASAPHEIPGNELFMEHVHFNYQGNWRMAELLGEFVTRSIPGAQWSAERVPCSKDRDELCGLIPEDQLMADAVILDVFSAPPCTGAPDIEAQIGWTIADLRRRFADLSWREQEVFGIACTRVGRTDLLGTLLDEYALAGMDAERAALLKRAVLRQPWRTEWVRQLSKSADGAGPQPKGPGPKGPGPNGQGPALRSAPAP